MFQFSFSNLVDLFKINYSLKIVILFIAVIFQFLIFATIIVPTIASLYSPLFIIPKGLFLEYPDILLGFV